MILLSDDVLDHLRDVVGDVEPDFSGTRYRLEERIGRGGMGVVYAAKDVELDRRVAIKIGAGSLTDHEAKVLASLEHPGIVPVHDVGVLPDGQVFYAMKLVKGERLDRWLAKNREAIGPALRLFQKICEAVAFAHAHGVLHRDVKPANVMVGEFGEALLMDWGIATTAADTAKDSAVAGTPSYMAPEQARGDAPAIDKRADVYGLGATLYTILTNEVPSASAANVKTIRGIPAPLASICAKAMAPNTADRYASADDVASDIASFLDGAEVSAHKESLVEAATRVALRHRVLLTLLAAYVVMRVILILIPR